MIPYVELGIYRHFKGGKYRVIGVAMHTETRQYLVIYRALYGEHELSARPIDEWIEWVERDGYNGPRFEYLGKNRLLCMIHSLKTRLIGVK